ncbi:general secretion pathway protein GspL [Alcaligenaceae bacterium CGII-47]|nr:general secretion pathway protein GspL [Alcaligenaceae bacterium CGII-47]
MGRHLRLALPPLSCLSADEQLAFAMIGRDGRLGRAGQLPLRELDGVAGNWPVWAILHPDDAIVTRLTVPPVSAKRLDAAVMGSIEPMVLSELDELVVAHGPRASDGSVTVAWSDRARLGRAWTMLAQAGLTISAFVPHQLALPAADSDLTRPLTLPADARWLAPLPNWSLARDELHPGIGAGCWRRPGVWGLAACAVWVLGLNGYAMQLDDQVQGLQQSMQQTVMQAFPQIPVILDPVRQAQQQRDALRLAQGEAATDDFIPLALATARVLDFAQGHVQSMQYEGGKLTIQLAPGYVPPANEAALAQAAAVQNIILDKRAAQPHGWHARRPGALEPDPIEVRRP